MIEQQSIELLCTFYKEMISILMMCKVLDLVSESSRATSDCPDTLPVGCRRHSRF